MKNDTGNPGVCSGSPGPSDTARMPSHGMPLSCATRATAPVSSSSATVFEVVAGGDWKNCRNSKGSTNGSSAPGSPRALGTERSLSRHGEQPKVSPPPGMHGKARPNTGSVVLPLPPIHTRGWRGIDTNATLLGSLGKHAHAGSPPGP